MQKIFTCLWFDGQAEAAAKFYVSIFKDSKIKEITHYGEAASNASGMPKGSVMTVSFELEGREFLGLNAGPEFKFNEAISLVVRCDSQKELDYYWDKLSAVKSSEQCGWLKDKFGLSWQIVPSALEKLISDKDPQRSERVMKAVISMKKLDINAMKAAYAGKG